MTFARSLLVAGFALATVAASQAQAQFTSAQKADMQLNGTASFNGSSQLVLTPASGGTSSAFFMTPTATSTLTSFDATFDYFIGGGSGADGLALVLQGNGPGALGGGGGGIGYNGIPNSIGALFRSYVYNIVQIGDGGNFNGPSTGASIRGTHSVEVSWSSGTQIFSVLLDGATGVSESGVDLAALIGPNMYVGFTAATGGANDEHRIDNLTVKTNDVTATPEPATLALTATGIMMLAAFKRRRSRNA